MQVKVRRDNVNKALSILRKKMTNDGRLLELKNRQFYEKPSQIRQRKKRAAKNREAKRCENS